MRERDRATALLRRAWRGALALFALAGLTVAFFRFAVGLAPDVGWAAVPSSRILYLHLMLLGFVTLGFVTLGLVAWCALLPVLAATRMATAPATAPSSASS